MAAEIDILTPASSINSSNEHFRKSSLYFIISNISSFRTIKSFPDTMVITNEGGAVLLQAVYFEHT